MVSKIDRAKQFKSFDALKGFKDLIEEKERLVCPKVELSEDACEELSNKIKELKIGMIIEIVFYSKKEYQKSKGELTKIDYFNKTIIVNNSKINFEDLYTIKIK